MLIKALAAARDLGRLHDISRVLIRHGFGDLVQRSGIAAALERAGRALNWERASSIHLTSTPERTRLLLEELGPTFVKLGQVLASRTDLLSQDWLEELSQLHEHVAPVDFEELRPRLEADLGAPPEEVFESLSTTPLASGSIAQVHRASLPDGQAVVLKIRRPGIRDEVLADLRLLARFAELLEQEVSELRRFRPRRVVRQFARTMREELDLRVEARNMAAIAENLEAHPAVVVPTVFPQWTSERLIVQTFLDGVSAAQWLRGTRPAGIDAGALAREGADAVLRMVFVDGLYHADPHPGNVVFLSGSRLGLLDFGMVGRLSERRRLEFVSLMTSVVDHDEEGVVNVLLEWSDDVGGDLEMLTQDARAFLDRYHGLPLKDLDVPGMLRDVADMARENDLALPADVALLIKVFVTLEGLGRALAPDFDMAAHVEPIARTMARRVHSPRAVVRRNMRELRRLLASLPGDLRALITRARRGGFKIEIDLERLERFGHQLDSSANRLTVGLITSALIVGTAIVMTIDKGPMLFGFPAIGLLGFLSSFVVGVGLLWSILRSGRK